MNQNNPLLPQLNAAEKAIALIKRKLRSDWMNSKVLGLLTVKKLNWIDNFFTKIIIGFIIGRWFRPISTFIPYSTLSSPPPLSSPPVKLEESWSLKKISTTFFCKKLCLRTYYELDFFIFVCFSYLNTMK